MTTTVTARFIVETDDGIHARPAAAIVNLANEKGVSLKIKPFSGVFKVVSIMTLFTAELNKGVEFDLQATGDKTEEFFQALTTSLKEGDKPVLKRLT